MRNAISEMLYLPKNSEQVLKVLAGIKICNVKNPVGLEKSFLTEFQIIFSVNKLSLDQVFSTKALVDRVF